MNLQTLKKFLIISFLDGGGISMKLRNKLINILSLAIGLLGAGLLSPNASAAKTMTVNYVSTTGQQLRSPITYTRSVNGINAFGNSYTYTTNSYPSTQSGYVKTIKGYVPHKIQQNYTYASMPTTLTVKYIKESTLARKVDTQYLKQINAYRLTKGLKAFKHNQSLKAKTVVRSKELWTKLSHIRPNGQSYNAFNSGYAEVMAVLPTYFTSYGISTYNSGQGATIVYNPNGYVSYKKSCSNCQS